MSSRLAAQAAAKTIAALAVTLCMLTSRNTVSELCVIVLASESEHSDTTSDEPFEVTPTNAIKGSEPSIAGENLSDFSSNNISAQELNQQSNEAHDLQNEIAERPSQANEYEHDTNQQDLRNPVNCSHEKNFR